MAPLACGSNRTGSRHSGQRPLRTSYVRRRVAAPYRAAFTRCPTGCRRSGRAAAASPAPFGAGAARRRAERSLEACRHSPQRLARARVCGRSLVRWQRPRASNPMGPAPRCGRRAVDNDTAPADLVWLHRQRGVLGVARLLSVARNTSTAELATARTHAHGRADRWSCRCIDCRIVGRCRGKTALARRS